MKNKLRILPPLLGCILLCVLLIPSCSKSKNNATASHVDSVLEVSQKGILTNPAATEKTLTDLLKTVSDSDDYYKIQLFRAIASFFKGDVISLEKIHTNVWAYCQSHPDSWNLRAIYWNHKAIVNQFQGKNDSVLSYFQHSYDALTHTGDYAKIIDLSINLADAYTQAGDLSEAAGIYRRALFLEDSVRRVTERFSILAGLGDVYARIGNYSQAEMYFTQAGTALNSDSPFSLFYYYISYGNNYYYQKRYKESLPLFRKAHALALKMNQSDALYISKANLGEILLHLGQIDSANYYLSSADKIFKKSGWSTDYSQRFYLNSLLGDYAVHAGKLSEAKKIFEDKIDTPKIQLQYLALHFERLSNFNAVSGDYKSAYKNILLAQRYNDSLRTQRAHNQLTELEYRYRQDTTLLNSHLKVAQKEEEVGKLRTAIFAVGFAALIIFIVIGFIYMYNRKKADLAQIKLRENLLSLRMDNMRNRISPHFVFNVLNRELAEQNEGVHNLVSLLRKNLELCDRYIIPLGDEIDFIDTYISTERGALGDNFTYDCKIDKDVDADTLLIPSMMIQIFVENAVKHGLRGYDKDKYLQLHINHDNGALHISIRNNGYSFDNTRRAQSSGNTGTGLKVVTQTIQILNERNRNPISLKFGADKDADGNDAWQVNIIIPDGYDFSAIDRTQV